MMTISFNKKIHNSGQKKEYYRNLKISDNIWNFKEKRKGKKKPKNNSEEKEEENIERQMTAAKTMNNQEWNFMHTIHT